MKKLKAKPKKADTVRVALRVRGMRGIRSEIDFPAVLWEKLERGAKLAGVSVNTFTNCTLAGFAIERGLA